MSTRSRFAFGVALILLSTATLALRLPRAFSQLHGQAKQNDAYTAQGRLLAAADSLSIDNGFVLAALAYVPPHATFAVLKPSAAAVRHQHLSVVTVYALPGFFRYLLLPRREVAPRQAGFVLCYACDRSSLAGQVHTLWSAPNGLEIGRVTGRS